MATAPLTGIVGRLYAGWDLERAEPIGEVTVMSLTMEELSPRVHGWTTYARPVMGSFVVDLSKHQAELLRRMLAMSMVVPAPVKPVFRGRRRAWRG